MLLALLVTGGCGLLTLGTRATRVACTRLVRWAVIARAMAPERSRLVSSTNQLIRARSGRGKKEGDGIYGCAEE